VVTTLIVTARSVKKRVALIVLPVNAHYVTEQGESTIRFAFALNVARRVRHSLKSPTPKFHYYFKNTPAELRLPFRLASTGERKKIVSQLRGAFDQQQL
jgi:hypothetical protein